MSPWTASPAAALQAVFSDIAATRMADLPLNNPVLCVEALGFTPGPEGQWVGTLVTPWAINLLCLPRTDHAWPATLPGGKHSWRFPSGDYEFTVAEEARLGVYHLCSLFSPALEFTDQEAARLTALAALTALMQPPQGSAPPSTAAPSRRAFLGLRG